MLVLGWGDDSVELGRELRARGVEVVMTTLNLDWVHLRICLGCGHVGCCDSSPGRHARAHHKRSDHPLKASLEPGETWGYCFLDDTTVEAPRPG